MFGREELGRSRMLREMAKRVAAGQQSRPDEIQSSCQDHVAKQRAAVLGLTLASEPPNPFDRLIREMMALPPGTEEYRQADDKLREAIEAKRKRLPQDRHDMRESALYVDLDNSGTRWVRPSALDRARCYDEICGAVNDYAGQYDPVRIEIVEQEFSEMAAARKAMSPQFDLPAPRWPNQ
jgi:AbiV family abortive infection protein